MAITSETTRIWKHTVIKKNTLKTKWPRFLIILKLLLLPPFHAIPLAAALFLWQLTWMFLMTPSRSPTFVSYISEAPLFFYCHFNYGFLWDARGKPALFTHNNRKLITIQLKFMQSLRKEERSVPWEKFEWSKIIIKSLNMSRLDFHAPPCLQTICCTSWELPSLPLHCISKAPFIYWPPHLLPAIFPTRAFADSQT